MCNLGVPGFDDGGAGRWMLCPAAAILTSVRCREWRPNSPEVSAPSFSIIYRRPSASTRTKITPFTEITIRAES